jgi:hypothetical protein
MRVRKYLYGILFLNSRNRKTRESSVEVARYTSFFSTTFIRNFFSPINVERVTLEICAETCAGHVKSSLNACVLSYNSQS